MAWGAGAVDSRFCTQVYAAELAPPKLRGPLGGLFNVFISAGILAVFALGARQCKIQVVATRPHHGSIMTFTPSTGRRLDGVALWLLLVSRIRLTG